MTGGGPGGMLIGGRVFNLSNLSARMPTGDSDDEAEGAGAAGGGEDDAASGAGVAALPSLSFTHEFVLEFPAESMTSQNVVQVRGWLGR